MNIEAPFPVFIKTIVLPDPALGDGVASVNSMQKHYSMDNTLRTYVKKTTDMRYTWQISLSRQKSLELLDLYRNYGGQEWQVTFNSTVFVGILNVDSLELANFIRAPYGDPGDQGYSAERLSVNLEFIG